MIQPEELRLGNLLHFHQDNGEIKVIQVTLATLEFILTEPEKFNKLHTPIKLNEEQLNRLGFDDEDYKEHYIGIDIGNSDFCLTKSSHPDMPIGKCPDQYFFQCKYGGWPRIKVFAYVHSLQNFFYAMYENDLVYQYPKNIEASPLIKWFKKGYIDEKTGSSSTESDNKLDNEAYFAGAKCASDKNINIETLSDAEIFRIIAKR